MADIRVGFSGWTYAPWRGTFYPPKHRIKEELRFASRKVTSIEINGTFYRTQKPESFRQWFDQTPDDFTFAVKAHQFITHRRRLKDVQGPLANFFASGLLALGRKLGPILWQFPPNLPLVDDRFEEFMSMLPHTSAEAADLAKRHDGFLKGRSLTTVDGDFPVRHAFEFRHSSFRDADFLALMRRHNVALVLADSGETSLGVGDLTADHVYVRMHGQDVAYEDGYTEAALQAKARAINAWAKGEMLPTKDALLLEPASCRPRPVSVYFDNDAKAHAPMNAMRLLEILNIDPLAPTKRG